MHPLGPARCALTRRFGVEGRRRCFSFQGSEGLMRRGDDDGTFTMADIGAPDDSDDEEAQLGKDTNPRQTLQEQLYTQPGSTTRAGQAGASASASTAPAQRNLPRESLDGETIFAVGEDGDRFSDDSDEENVKLVHSGK
ncbi:hypothetical protein HYQ44_010108 [Verticillium longisporum]|nr:hypothetical protein HYQ44_010108 [Verticillium longisporum]